MEALWSRRHLTIYLPRFAESAMFSNSRKMGDGCGEASLQPISLHFSCQRPSAALILLFLAASTTHGPKLALRYETFENRSQEVLQCRGLQKINQTSRHEGSWHSSSAANSSGGKQDRGDPCSYQRTLDVGHHKKRRAEAWRPQEAVALPLVDWLTCSGLLHGECSLYHCSTHTRKAKIRVKVSKKHRNTQTALPKPKPKKSAEEERVVGCKREGERGEERKGWGERQKHKALFWKELHEGSTRVWVWTQGLSVKKQRAELGRWWLRGWESTQHLQKTQEWFPAHTPGGLQLL